MGLNASSDELCFYSDLAITGSEWALKIVDDILVQAPDMPTLLQRIQVVM